MPLLHLPVQSGSTKILKDMNRDHTIEDYLKTIEKLKKVNPAIKFSSDFIIAYPGETEKDFNETLSLMEQVEFINSYSFIFSPRPGTPASKMPAINSEVAKNRLHIFQKKADEVKTNYRKKLVNSSVEVLFENKIKNEDKYFGRDKYFNSVIVNSKNDLTGKIKKVKINQHNRNTLFGEIIFDINKKDCAA